MRIMTVLLLAGAFACAFPAHAAQVAPSGGTAVAWGQESSGQLGTSGTPCCEFLAIPSPITAIHTITAIAAGGRFGLAVRADGTVWAWGANDTGQLGRKPGASLFLPRRVPDISGAVAVAAGGYHSLALRRDGTVWAWGGNSSGQLGSGNERSSSTPSRVHGLDHVVQIAADQFGSAALRNDGTVWTWGRLDSLGDLPNSVVPIQVSGISHVTSIGMGGAHILAIRQDGTVWAWGDNDGGQLGRQDVRATGTPVQVRGTGGKGYLSGVTVVAGGAVTSVAVRRDGSVLTWGGAFNYTHDSAVFPHRVSGLPHMRTVTARGSHFFGLAANGTVWGWGDSNEGLMGRVTHATGRPASPGQVQGLKGVTAIATGDTFGMALTRTPPPVPRAPSPRACVHPAAGTRVPRVVLTGNALGELRVDDSTGHVFALNAGSYDAQTGWYTCATSVSTLDGATGRLVGNTLVGHGTGAQRLGPAMAIHPAAHTLWVANAGDFITGHYKGIVSVLDTRTGRLQGTLPAGPNPAAIGIDDGRYRAFITSASVGPGTGQQVNVAAVSRRAIVSHIDLPSPGTLLGVDQHAHTAAYLTGQSVTVVEGGRNEVVNTAALPPGVFSDAVIDQRTDRLFIAEVGEAPHDTSPPPSSISVIDMHTGAVVRTLFAQTGLFISKLAADDRAGVVVSTDGSGVTLLNRRDGSIHRSIPSFYGTSLSPTMLATDETTGRVFVLSVDTVFVLDPSVWKLERVVHPGVSGTQIVVDRRTRRAFVLGYVRSDTWAVALFCVQRNCR